MSPHSLGRVALAHDYLNQRGGAERVALTLTQIFPEAPLYTSLYRAESTFPGFAGVEIHSSFLDRLPVDGGFRALLPLYPAAFAELSPVPADLVVASSSGWAHGIRVAPPGRLCVYCHNPARWLYGEPYFGSSSSRQRAIGPLLPWLRRWDRRAARRADQYVANSKVTQARLRAVYGLDAPVIPPPVDTARFHPTPRGERLLVVSRLLPYKRIDLVVAAATQSGLGLDIVGTGPCEPELRAAAGSTVRFHGAVDDATVTELLQGCRALCLPGVEDFGMIAVEAQAAGKPVIAFGAGGALETVEDGVTGVFFGIRTAAALLEAVRTCDALETPPETIAARAERFSTASFAAQLLALLQAPGRR